MGAWHQGIPSHSAHMPMRDGPDQYEAGPLNERRVSCIVVFSYTQVSSSAGATLIGKSRQTRRAGHISNM